MTEEPRRRRGGGGGGRVVRSVKANGITEELVFLRWPLSVTRRRKEEEERGRAGIVWSFLPVVVPRKNRRSGCRSTKYSKLSFVFSELML